MITVGRRVSLGITHHGGTWIYRIVAYGTLGFLLLPIIVVVVASFGSGRFVSFPPRLPLSGQWYRAFVESETYIPALKTSLIIGGLVVAVSVTIGTAAAVGFTSRSFRGKQTIYELLFLPFLIPGLVIGIGILMSLDPLGLDFLVGNRWMVVIGHSLWATPLVFVVMVAVLLGIDPNLVAAAKSLGAGPIRAFREVTLPLARAGVLASVVLAFIISFHEFIIALFLTNPTSRTLPVVVWNTLRFEVSPIIAAVDTLMVVSVVIGLLMVGKLVGIDKIRVR